MTTYHRKARLWLSIITTTLQLAALTFILLWLLPRLGTDVPLWVMVILGVIWIGWEVFTFRRGTKALEQPPLSGTEALLGCIAKVITPLTPDGQVRLCGEVWQAKSAEGDINAGVQVVVITKEGLRLLVKRADTAKSKN